MLNRLRYLLLWFILSLFFNFSWQAQDLYVGATYHPHDLASITSLDKDYPVIPSNKYGKGRAIYVGLPAKGETLNTLLDDLITELSIKKGPDVPNGVMARQIGKNHFLYLNVTGESKKILMKGKSKSILLDKDYAGNFRIPAYEPEFIEVI